VFVYCLKRAFQPRYSLLGLPEYHVQYEQALGNQEHVAARCTISNINATVINSTHTIHQFRASPSRHGYVPLKKASISVMTALCSAGVRFWIARRNMDVAADGALGAGVSEVGLSAL
jgi:hypothetical protein